MHYLKVFDHSPDTETLRHMPRLTPFGETVVEFVDAFSKTMLASPDARLYPELAALAFWFRRASVEKIRQHALDEHRIHVPRGIAFHVAPANVDTIFIYSWFLSLLCGNSNIVRISSKPSRQVELILGVLAVLFEDDQFRPVRDRTLIVQYGHDAEVNACFSSLCDIRLVWGGDLTIRELRKAPLSATAIEMTFADKYSLAVIDVDTILDANPEKLIRAVDGFFNDTYWFGQMACSSPRMIVWLGGDLRKMDDARSLFWAAFEKRLESADIGLDMSDYINKKVAVDSLALHENIRVEKSASNDIVRVWLQKPELHDDLHCGAGLFFEIQISDIDDMISLLSRKIQTISYLGVEKERWNDFLKKNNVPGIDRIVPFGKALDFGYVWDGYDMPRLLLREIAMS